MIAVFTLALLLSSALLFSVQPLFARLVLPLLGGTPAVWNTCMVFFQAMLLAGYGYAHLSTRWLGVRRQLVVHAGLILLPLGVLPFAVPPGWTPPAETNPIPWLLGLLTVVLGLPFFVVSATAPLLQRWISGTDHPDAADPYFLYAASNVGSMTALLAYPFLLEPHLRLAAQTSLWRWGYVALVLLLGVCAWFTWRRLSPADADQTRAPVAALPLARRLRWVALAAVPSSLMLGVTTYLTTDVAVVPLLWIVPLALYLLTFILVFARRPPLPHAWMVRALPVVVVSLVLVMVIRATEPLALIVILHLVGFFTLAMVCHGELARDRPPATQLTGFYVWMSLGGVVGGAVNALIAPLIFPVVAEYPLAIVAACVLWPGNPTVRGLGPLPWRRAVLWPAGLLALAVVLRLVAAGGGDGPMSHAARSARVFVTLGTPALLAFLMSGRPRRFALALGAVFLAGAVAEPGGGTVLARTRGFFGAYRVAAEEREVAAAAPLRTAAGDDGQSVRVHTLYHGTTVHGRQLTEVGTGQPTAARVPLTYYHRAGPLGRLMMALAGGQAPARTGVVGLGAGAVAAYAGAGVHVTFYEIDPRVGDVAEDARYFTYLSAARARGAAVDVVLGDARLTLADVPAGTFDLLVLDAFSSDAVPVHLLTVEALALYAARLAPGGVLAFHVSNRYLRLEPVLAAAAARLDLAAWMGLDEQVGDEGVWWDGRSGSRWVFLARAGEVADLPFPTLTATPGAKPWTDDFADILSVLDWGG